MKPQKLVGCKRESRGFPRGNIWADQEFLTLPGSDGLISFLMVLETVFFYNLPLREKQQLLMENINLGRQIALGQPLSYTPSTLLIGQPLFAFEWQEDGDQSGQLTWTRLPQGFKNSPTLFNEALSQDLEPFRRSHPRVTLLQYVDDLLLAAETQEECIKATEHLLTELVTQVRADLKDTPLSGCKLNWYTDGSSFFQDGARRAGAAVVDQEGNTVWSSALPPGTSAQKAELIALAEALERAKGKRVNIYTDSRYAFGTIHVHGAIYRERGFRTAEGKHLKNLAEVQRLLMAVEKPKAVAVMYVPGHQSAKTPEAVGNNRADQEAKRVAMVSPPMETGQPSTVAAIDVPVPELPPLPPRPEYSTEDFTWMRAHSPFREGEDGWKSDLEGKLILPEKLGRFLLANLHKSTHLGRRKLLDLLTSAQLRFPNQTIAVRQIVEDCASCTIMKPGRREGHHTGTRERGRAPGRSWEVDFTEVKPGKFGYKYLLVFIDTFSGWVEAFPTKKETSQVVAKALLEEIIPRYGVPEAIGSDNGPAFVSKVLQGLAQTMGANWKLHCEYNPQSSGQVERMNRTLKETLAKLALETGGDWVTLLPLAIFRVRNSPYVHGLTPFEILYGAPPPIIQRTLSPELEKFLAAQVPMLTTPVEQRRIALDFLKHDVYAPSLFPTTVRT
ncbi:uncharacterized protein [Castor canadensis]|uniref:Uncharacterized protein n=1 Tax=Castor canadensis TaxID=51338 RepID=A0AC58MFP4_CASCN